MPAKFLAQLLPTDRERLSIAFRRRIEVGNSMDSFEQVVAEILWAQGFWVRTSVKVNLTKAEKVKIERGSSPRWELDIVAYNARDNILNVVECKSYLDSPGVQTAGFVAGTKAATRFKLFNDARLRETIFSRLAADFESSSLCRPAPTVKLCLACGNIQKRSRPEIERRFEEEGWILWDERWLREKLKKLGQKESPYENQIASVVAKIIIRGGVDESR